MGNKVKCADCGADYSKMGLDITLPDEQWDMISKGDNILCGACIARRGWKLPDAVAIRASIEFSGNEAHYDFIMDDGRVAHLWRADRQEYQNVVFDSGLVEGLPPEDIYLRLERDGTEHYFFFERDEAQSIAWLLNGALWSMMMREKIENDTQDKIQEIENIIRFWPNNDLPIEFTRKVGDIIFGKEPLIEGTDGH